MKIEVKKEAVLKLAKKFPWVYKNEIKEHKECDIGSVVDVYYKDEFLGVGFYNPKSEISIRMLSFQKEIIDKKFFEARIKNAVQKRKSLFKITNSCRLVHSEADMLPGLIVDKYGDNLVVMFTSAGMDNFKGVIIEILIKLLKPKGIYEKGDKIRKKEGLEITDQTLYGSVDCEFLIKEYDKKFFTSLKEGQKSGFFLDQRKNRKIISQYGAKKTLDLFANAGGFGIYSGAEFVKFVEISALACSLIEKNCTLNSLENYEIVKSDVFKFLESEKQKYDLIIIDPPAFAKRKKEKKGALKGWKYLIVNSLKLLEEGGRLALFSCSHHINTKDLLDLALSSSLIEGCELEVLEFLKQDIDHPYVINIPNSLYLTGVLLRRV
ncbi:MAG: class I SAM-dependent rRNA methyltransferase [Epsilonproteobacteria bacterium]|nr:class I SAM-dependent rRNA methyltransferase [Campylobacterota bacterium]